ncbi:hypothetical protein [Pelagicoccus mobilis]
MKYSAISRTFVTTLALLTLAFAASSLQGASDTPPNRMTVQSYITDDGGTPLGNAAPVNKKMVFSLYNADTGGTVVFADEQIVTVDKGHFSVVLGEGSEVSGQNHELSTAFSGSDASDRFLEIQVSDTDGSNAQTLSPRLRLLPSAYAFLASYANEAAKVSSDGIDTAAIKNGAITSDKVAINSLVADDLAADSVGASELAPNSVASENIINGTIALADMGSNSVNSSNIVNDSIGYWDIAPNAVGQSELGNNAVTSSHVVDNSLGAADIGSNSIGQSELAPNAVTGGHIYSNTITSSDIATNGVRGNEIVGGLFEYQQVYIGSGTDFSYTFSSREVSQWWPILTGWSFGYGDLAEDGSGNLLELYWRKNGSGDWYITAKAKTHINNADVYLQIMWVPSRLVNDYNSTYKTRTRGGDQPQL